MPLSVGNRVELVPLQAFPAERRVAYVAGAQLRQRLLAILPVIAGSGGASLAGLPAFAVALATLAVLLLVFLILSIRP